MEDLMGIASVPVITVLSFVIGYICKSIIPSEAIDKHIPVICLVAGAILGIAVFFFAPDIIPATDAFTSAAIGAASGWAATGLDQVLRQYGAK